MINIDDNGFSHVILKDETLKIWHQAAKIVEDVKKGKNFFLSGDVVFTKPLPQRLVAIYSLLSGHEIIDEWEPNIKNKIRRKVTIFDYSNLSLLSSLGLFGIKDQ